jgi:hypothetical protein
LREARTNSAITCSVKRMVRPYTCVGPICMRDRAGGSVAHTQGVYSAPKRKLYGKISSRHTPRRRASWEGKCWSRPYSTMCGATSAKVNVTAWVATKVQRVATSASHACRTALSASAASPARQISGPRDRRTVDLATVVRDPAAPSPPAEGDAMAAARAHQGDAHAAATGRTAQDATTATAAPCETWLTSTMTRRTGARGRATPTNQEGPRMASSQHEPTSQHAQAVRMNGGMR